MDLKQQLQALGYNDGEIEAISNKSKVYFQNDVDNIVMKKENSLKDKFSKTYVSKADYDTLTSDYNNLVKDVKTKAIKEEFIKNGGNEKHFNDYLKINSQLMNLEDEALTKDIKSSVNRNSWAFTNDASPDIPYNYQDRVADPEAAGFDGASIYGKYNK